ncbi:DUF1269 domain-containing protein [Jiangella rhizosphaerae]|uniref:DUF1269 domain-containing protein n=2 Tax=Jiangella rhizosphaerae TaxID=2293569 RepID=A0A418KY93_9ACTN|nr:DUF1269 domain-containing protein [Jiangella rhizosphaerae]
MATFTVWTFDDPAVADHSVALLESMRTRDVGRIHDAATVSWPHDREKPRTHHLASVAHSGALGGTFWGLLFGTLFFVPLLGAALGPAADALGQSLADVGIDDDFIRQIRDRVTPGTSALFALTSDAASGEIIQALDESGINAELLDVTISDEQEELLKEAFAEARHD